MAGAKNFRDPRGHSLRIYDDVFDSPAFKALTGPDVMAYLALLRELKGGYNNGNLSLPLSRSKTCGISHPKTLARALRTLCAVGLVAKTREGGCTKGGQRLPNLYRVTDRECFEIPKLFLSAMPATNEWKEVASVEEAQALIKAAEEAAIGTPEKLKSLGHAVKATGSLRATVGPEIVASGDPWNAGPWHPVNMAETASNPMPMRVAAEFQVHPGNLSHRAPRSTPMYLCQGYGDLSPFDPSTDNHAAAEPTGLQLLH